MADVQEEGLSKYSEISQRLKDAREEKGYSLNYVAAVTRINISILHSIEDGDLKNSPGPVFVRGVIRTYGKLVGLEEQELQTMMDAIPELQENTPHTCPKNNVLSENEQSHVGIIAEIAYDWQKSKVKNSGKSILLEPGVIGEHANQKLVKFQRRIGPDPASLKAARIGGIVANNASGMTTGKPCNSYNTLKNIRFILANENLYDTSNKDDYDNLILNDKILSDKIISIKKEILEKDNLRDKILDKFRKIIE